jgi:hypothetical protein
MAATTTDCRNKKETRLARAFAVNPWSAMNERTRKFSGRRIAMRANAVWPEDPLSECPPEKNRIARSPRNNVARANATRVE